LGYTTGEAVHLRKERIDISIDLERSERCRRRFEALSHFGYVDRVSVQLGIEARFCLHERGVSWGEYFSDPVTQMRHQLLSQKLIYENSPDDRAFTGSLMVVPDFQNVVNASAAGCEVIMSDREAPRARPFIRDEQDAWKVEVPATNAGLWGTIRDWYHKMREARDRFDVRVNGEPIKIVVHAQAAGDTPFITCLDAAQHLYLLWMAEAPDLVHHMMDKYTTGLIQSELEFRKLRGVAPDGGFWLTDDPVAMISREQYEEFVAPYTLRIYEALAGEHNHRGMHLCGRHVHVIPTFQHYLRISSLDGAGYENPPEAYVGNLAGKAIIRGNLDPRLIYEGPPSAIREETFHILSVLAPYGGLQVQDGYNILPETPWSHMRAVVEAAEEYGHPPSEVRHGSVPGAK
jgi:uroporphyrinogen-III decarboxylase